MTKKAQVGGRIMVAIESFTRKVDGVDQHFVAGSTRVREGHPAIAGVEHLFKPLEVHYEIEQASAAPGEVRGG